VEGTEGSNARPDYSVFYMISREIMTPYMISIMILRHTSAWPMDFDPIYINVYRQLSETLLFYRALKMEKVSEKTETNLGTCWKDRDTE
jgi:hypothetical protein